jgi:MoxR-like ATPase
MDVDDANAVVERIKQEVMDAVVLEERFLDVVLSGALAGGHVLLEDVPGTGKTLTASSLAEALGLSFKRIQFTPDLLPADITGSYIYDEQEAAFRFKRGPIFANVVLADEINRAPPKTQAALLEAMGEEQVSVGGETHPLPDPFLVIATQNPVEQEGTFELPEAQRDRFIVKTSIGYPERAGERELIDRRAARASSTPSVDGVVEGSTVTALQAVPEHVTVEDRVRDYVVDLGRATREADGVEVGVSPRGTQRLFEAARAHAIVAGRDYVAPDDVKAVARPVIQHRVVLTAEASVRSVETTAVVDDVLESVEVPAVADAD